MKEKLQNFMQTINKLIEKVGIDKLVHFFVGAWFVSEFKVFQEPLYVGLAFVFITILAYLKEELFDKEFTFMDIWFSMAGGMMSILLYVVQYCIVV